MIPGLIVKEIAFRRVNFLLSLLAVITAVALFVSVITTGRASERETTRLMRDMGLNLRIIPAGTDENAFWDRGFSDLTMPEEYARMLADHGGIGSNHITAFLVRTIEWRGQKALLTGIAPEVFPPGKKKPPIIDAIEPGTVYVGRQLAQSLEIRRGESVIILGTKLRVAGCGPETGTDDDIRIQCRLSDVQEMLGLPGRINEIRAIDCLCSGSGEEPLARLRSELARILPDTEVFLLGAKARARREQRIMVRDTFAGIVFPLVVVVAAVWIALLSMLNVRERRIEIGIMRALGYGGGGIALLFLGRAFLMGVAGAGIGFAAGTALALGFGPDVFKVTAVGIRCDWTLLAWSLAAAPLLSCLAGFVLAMAAVTQDPALSLRQE